MTLTPEARAEVERGDELPEIVVMASGCLGLVSFPREPGRVTLERLTELHPRLVDALRAHPGIGFVAVRSEQHGAVALGGEGAHYLDEERIDGEDPLAPFGPGAAHHLRRTDGFAHVADIMVGSFYDPELDEGCAFEELISFHGGLGGPQTEPFLLHPPTLPVPDAPIVGAAAVHDLLVGWRALLEDPAEAPRDVASAPEVMRSG